MNNNVDKHVTKLRIVNYHVSDMGKVGLVVNFYDFDFVLFRMLSEERSTQCLQPPLPNAPKRQSKQKDVFELHEKSIETRR